MCGLDARPLTLRQLSHAALARRQDEWDRTAALESWIELKATGRQINPDRLNPYRRAPRRRRGPVGEEENKVAWKVLGDGLRSMGKR